jgi:hypothetical protein
MNKNAKKNINKLEVKEQYLNNLSIEELAKKFNCSQTMIRIHLKNTGVVFNKKEKIIINKEELLKIYKEVKSIKKIANFYKCSKTVINKKIKEFGLELNVARVYKKPKLNEKFNMLTFKEEIKEKGKKVFWRCKCDCGNEKIALARGVRVGVIKSCGCYRGIASRNRFKNISFGDITGGFWYKIKKSAESRNKDFEITIEDAWNLFEKQKRKCALSNLELNFYAKNKTKLNIKNRIFFLPSLDRIDSNIGYIKGNIQWVCQEINMMKWKLSQEDFKFLCEKINKN